MGLMEPGCTLEDFGRPAQPAAPNRLRCRAQVVSERYLRENLYCVGCVVVLACAWLIVIGEVAETNWDFLVTFGDFWLLLVIAVMLLQIDLPIGFCIDWLLGSKYDGVFVHCHGVVAEVK